VGWFNSEHPGHEGYLVGLQRDESGVDGFRELGFRKSATADSPDLVEQADIKTLQVACECGWRSARFMAPVGTAYAPHMIFLSDHSDADLREVAAELWTKHLGDVDVWAEYRRRRDVRLVELSA
jgi:hypothetical protein